MFSNFMWGHHINVLLPAKSSVRVPVIFNRTFANSSVTECYIIAFDNTEYTIPHQRVDVIGRVIDQQILVDPGVIDVGLCYLTSSVQMASFQLRNTSRVVVPYEIKLPRELSRHAELSHSKGYLKAESSMEIFIRLRLKYDLLRPDECKTYFDSKTGVLDFPVRVYQPNCKKFNEVRVLAVVTTSFGLKLTPDTLDFGTVNTAETVVRDVMLANHSRTKMEYGFLKLPERISVRPSAFGTIFSGEQICLQLHYSPAASDLPQNVHTYDDDFVLTCDTVTGLNAEICPFQNDTTTQINETIYETINETINEQNISNTIINQNSTVSENEIKELNHGPDKILVSILKDEVEVYSFDKNAILRQATLRCLAKIHDVPVELSVQKIIFGKTHFTSYSVFKIDLR
ncbi:cilia- and flagella-associated protein 74-like [Metopolophium dirhodum]|uniref:cilia- and flagella-associated protein 74-like n=1 Tax=Metopolophium dirhodum TaxID=44670 RepID=UPI00299048CE|nr:cilia- and flagella-associated protein 74-like [Metopolophium dirhodum]